MTRSEIQTLQIGDALENTMDTVDGKAQPNARYSQPRKVVEIYGQGDNVNGEAYVCFYTEFGPNSRISGSLHEGEEYYRKVS